MGDTEDATHVVASQSSTNKPKALKSSTVSKPDDLQYDLGNILAVDSHPVSEDSLVADPSKHLQKVVRENVQLLLNKVFVLPTRRVEDGVIVELPKPTTRLPREKHVPLPKPLTRWEEYSKIKGIKKNQKRSRMVFDETSGEYKPRWGYQKADDPNQEWVIESKPGDVDNAETDPFLRKKQEKKEKVEKQKTKEIKNKERSAQTEMKSLPGVISINNQPPRKDGRKSRVDKEALNTAVNLANISTASIGRFDKVLKGQKPVVKKSKLVAQDSEKEQSLALLDRVLKKREKVPKMNKAVSNIITKEQEENLKKKRKFQEDKESYKKTKRFTKKKKIK